MSDAVKVGFVPFSATPRGILVVFCDDTLKFGPATRKALGTVANLVKRAAETNQFKGKSGAVLDLLEPQGIEVQRLLVVGTGKPLGLKGKGFSQVRWRRRREIAAGQWWREHYRRIAGRRDEP